MKYRNYTFSLRLVWRFTSTSMTFDFTGGRTFFPKKFLYTKFEKRTRTKSRCPPLQNVSGQMLGLVPVIVFNFTILGMGIFRTFFLKNQTSDSNYKKLWPSISHAGRLWRPIQQVPYNMSILHKNYISKLQSLNLFFWKEKIF